MRSDKEDTWTFWDLTGCPDELIVHLIQLAQLAKQNEYAATNTWLTFDLAPITATETALREWQSEMFAEPSYHDFTSDSSAVSAEADFNAQMDRFHCAEAWRLALLVYSQRVFRWDRTLAHPSTTSRIARMILDHVRACRRISQTQKQLLLPVFLAGSEVEDDFLRQCAKSYCTWWARRSHYKMFDTVGDLLEDIWNWRRESPSSWWGDVIERKMRSSDAGTNEAHYLFG